MPYGLMKAVEGLNAVSLEQTLLWTGVAAASQIISGLLAYALQTRAATECLTLDRRVRTTLFQRAIGTDFVRLTEASPANWAARIISTANSYKSWLNALYNVALPLLVTSLGTCVVLLSLSWSLALISFALLPLCALFFAVLRRRVRNSSQQYFETNEAQYRAFNESFHALVPMRALHRQNWLTERFDRCSKALVDAGVRYYKTLALQRPVFDLFQALILVALFGIGGYFVLNDQATLPLVIGFQLYLARLFNVMRASSTLYASFQEFVEGRQRANEIQQFTKTAEPKFDHAQEPEILRLDHVSFAFGEQVIWNDFSLRLTAGERHAILAPSGRGKTTLARLILGLYQPTSGTIALPNGTTQTIGFVPQENFLITGTLRENIEFLSGKLAQTDLDDLCEICGLTELAQRLGNASIGQFGQKLSGGEQRRVMLARALATNPSLLLIDQLTSDLEPVLCDYIFETLKTRRPKLGILYFGHRSPFNQQTNDERAQNISA